MSARPWLRSSPAMSKPGFVYKTDAAVSKKVKIVYEVPIDKGPKITYPVAIVKESETKTPAQDFLNFTLSPVE